MVPKAVGKVAIALVLVAWVNMYTQTLTTCLPQRSTSSSTTQQQQHEAEFTPFTPSDSEIVFTPNSIPHGKNATMAQLRSMRSLKYVNARVPYFSCNAPKTGVTLWTLFYLYLNSGIVVTKEQTDKEAGFGYRVFSEELKAYQTSGLNVSDDTLMSMVQTHDRIVIARNPYVRFLSSYQDWQGRKNTHHVPFRQYAEWIESGAYKHLDEFHGYPMDHSLPVTQTCNYDALGYIVLRVEEQAMWFHAMLKRYQLTDVMQEYVEKSGNAVYTSVLPDDARLSDYVAQMLGRQEFPSQHFSAHNRDSVGKLRQYYTPEIVDICTRVFLNDFKAFHYPLWDGSNTTFALV